MHRDSRNNRGNGSNSQTAARRALLTSICLALLGAGSAALAQAWPAKPIRLVIGFAPGGAADFVARTIADPLGRALGQSVVVENRAGAGSSLAADFVAKAADMDKSVDGKNYYRFAGAFIGLHGWAARAAGLGGAYANIGGNPVAYAGLEVYDAWKSYFMTGQMKGVDTLKTLRPEGNGNLVDKGGQLQLGFSAAEVLRGKL